jgi:hypothetical protein
VETAPSYPLPSPGQQVRWRDWRHALAVGWLHAIGPGPFVVVRVVDKSALGIPPAAVVRTSSGEREINLVWLALGGGRTPR